jgi:uncharacterized protein (TIGR00369 family)
MKPEDLAMWMKMMPFAGTLGLEIESATPEEVIGRMPWREEICTGGGVVHGGALMGMADSIGAVCAFLNLPPGANTATISSSTNMLRAVREGVVTGSARPLHIGRSVIAVRTDLTDDQGRLVAQITQAQAVLAG